MKRKVWLVNDEVGKGGFTVKPDLVIATYKTSQKNAQTLDGLDIINLIPNKYFPKKGIGIKEGILEINFIPKKTKK